MAGIDVSYGANGDALIVWFDHPSKVSQREKKGPDLIVKKDAGGNLIGVEHLSYFARKSAAPPAAGFR